MPDSAFDHVTGEDVEPDLDPVQRDLGQDNFLYVADSALVTEDNLKMMDDWDNGFRFVSRLPLSYKACRGAIAGAVRKNAWEDLGTFSDEPVTQKRKPAHYHGFETVVDLYGVNYQAVVIHSDAHDKRRLKKLDKQLAQDRKQLAQIRKEFEKIEFACEPDVVDAAKRIPRLAFHRLTACVVPKPQYGRGRPREDGTRTPKEMRYSLKIASEVNERAFQRATEEAGCFVLITNILAEGTESISAAKLLATYKEQHVVEQNFGFLKDPVFVNALFLKSPKRIEALGLVLVLALLIWRLMERTMRLKLAERESTVTGWDDRQTSRPTSFMMTTKFKGIFVLTTADR